MKAAVLETLGDNLVVRDDVETMPVGPGQVRIAVKATCLCHSDLSAMNGVVRHQVPFVPGHEGAGEITEVGDDVVGLAKGDRVMICWMPPCGRCAACRRGESSVCRSAAVNFSRANFTAGDTPVYGFSGFGTFAEELVVDANAAIPIPDDVPYATAALIGCGATTGIGAAMYTAEVRPGQSVAVIGLGGVGLSAIQGAKVCGAGYIIAVDPVEARREWAVKFGATHTASPEDAPALIKELTGGVGVDVAFEVVGRPQTLRAAYDAVRLKGTVCLVGVGRADDAPILSMAEMVATAKQIRPSFYGGKDTLQTFADIWDLYRAGRLDLDEMITHRCTLDTIGDAIAQMRSGEAIRTVIEIG